MPLKIFLDTAPSKKKFEGYKPGTRRNSASNAKKKEKKNRED